MSRLICPYLQRTLDDLDAATTGCAADTFPLVVTGSWTLTHVLEHLGKAYGGTAHIMEQAVADGAPKGSPPRLDQRLIAAVIVRGWYFPRGVKSPAVAMPDGGMSGTAALTFAREQLIRLDAACSCSLQTFGPGARVANHPLLGGFTVPQWRAFHHWHSEHHLRQIRAAFP